MNSTKYTVEIKPGRNEKECTGFVGIDEIKITRDKCPVRGDCNFESDLCTWTNSKTIKWDRSQGESAFRREAPSTDHTFNTSAGT